MENIINELREFELKIADRLSETEQLELHHLVSVVNQRGSAMQEAMEELTNGRWEKL